MGSGAGVRDLVHGGNDKEPRQQEYWLQYSSSCGRRNYGRN